MHNGKYQPHIAVCSTYHHEHQHVTVRQFQLNVITWCRLPDTEQDLINLLSVHTENSIYLDTCLIANVPRLSAVRLRKIHLPVSTDKSSLLLTNILVISKSLSVCGSPKPAIDVLRNQIRPSVVGLNEKSCKPAAALWRMADLVQQTNLMIWLQDPGMKKKKKTPLSQWK